MCRGFHPFTALVLLGLLCAGGLSDGAEDSAPGDPHIRWREGPIRYIISGEEDREYKQLETDADRTRFIERFWARRDPDPATLINEYRHEFWSRVATSNSLFTESSKPGWKTDRGRYYILLGPPDDRDTSLENAPGFGQTGIRGAIIWRYRHAPSERLGTGITLVFTRDASGEFRITSDPSVVRQVVSSQSGYLDPSLGPFGIPLLQLPPRLSDTQLLLDLGRLEEVPTPDDLLTAIVTAREFLGVIPFEAGYDFFAGPGQQTLVALTASVRAERNGEAVTGGRPREFLLVGRIDSLETGGGETPGPRYIREADFSPAPRHATAHSTGPFIYQSMISLPPGRYSVSLAAYDRRAHRFGSFTQTIVVPSFPETGLSLSSISLSDSIESLPGSMNASGPYIFGRLRVTPRLVPKYRNGETFAVYYQVYRGGAGPAPPVADLDIEYQFYVDDQGAFVPIGNPIHVESSGNTSQGWSFPLHDWPSAQFKLRVTVTDPSTGQTATGEVGFEIL